MFYERSNSMLQLIRKDSGEGVVCARGNGRILVAPVTLNINPAPSLPRKSCAAGGCGRCGGCMSLMSIPNGYAGSFYVPVRDPEAFVPGDRVRFCRFIPEPNIMSALVFGIPVTFAMAVMLYWLIAAPREAETSYAVFSVAAAFFSGFIVLGFLDRLFKKRYPSSIIGDSSTVSGSAGMPVDNHGQEYITTDDNSDILVDNHANQYISDSSNVNTDGVAAHRETQNTARQWAKGSGGDDF